METVAVLHNNPALLNSDDPVKISRSAVKKILRRTRLLSYSNFMLKYSFAQIQKRADLYDSPAFNLENLKDRLRKITLDEVPSTPITA